VTAGLALFFGHLWPNPTATVMGNQMDKKHLPLTLVILLLVATTLHAQKKEAGGDPVFKNGDPPPASAMALSVPKARAAVKEAVQRTYVGTIKACVLLTCSTSVHSAAANLQISQAGISFDAPLTLDNRPFPGNVSVAFNIGYIEAYKAPICAAGDCYLLRFLPKNRPAKAEETLVPYYLDWTDEATAQRFADAFNRLEYAAIHPDIDTNFSAFSAAAKEWRDNPAKPPLSPEADRHRVLAENAIQEKNIDSAVEHYESAVEVQPMWPQGWFNLGLLYAEQSEFAEAADRMKHYVELAPDAPDAQGARNQIVIWEDKAKNGR
jgi:hypothetical protein